ncbi:ligase-associated DNA damage response DEXH box helicase [Kaustia mangrovi]|uniref:Ligase-associated DNA damage response DEXH box helicase n=1 Tax=Kaustia mangrovi TaxID=2593653 RepID=A0A7S8C8F8_9HYPH|nr:ligase-associated DNA damage response DEXH box helicase [Kaustia mangrovi]QPC45325.1 ligase-associated DNA damage response DEXH box helicase [Kaustia mangrovi]
MTASEGQTGVTVRAGADLLPRRFADWFAGRGWQPRRHQLELLEHGLAGRSALLIAPTGGGKTLAGFLASLVELGERAAGAARAGSRLHTLYISPLKALAVDIARNLEAPVAEMGLDIRIETRTGDTPQGKRRRQRLDPPDILIATPEQLALMIAYPDAERFFSGLRCVVLDELHALVASKRGALLSLGLARLARIAPQARRTGLSATVADPDALRAWLVPQPVDAPAHHAALVEGDPGPPPDISILESVERVPWSGHSARYAIGEIYEAIRARRMVLVFVNTRSQAELVFQELWHVNEDTLPIALHHGSLDVSQRRRVEQAMSEGTLRAVVCTSTLDLGIDWGDVDLVVNVGAPKGASRLMQRIGRANHRLNEPSHALLVPSNRFEVLECQAAEDAAADGEQDTEPPVAAKLDVLAQHVLGVACAGPFDADALYREIRSAAAYMTLARADFDAVVDFVATGGYALRSYERFARLRRTPDGLWRLAHPRIAQQYRLNVGTIVEADMLKVRLARQRGRGARRMVGPGGRVLGEIEEYFIEQLAPGDTFLFAGHVLRFERLEESEALVTRTSAQEPRIPAYMGGKFPLSTYLAARVRAMLDDPERWRSLPPQVRDWLSIQRFKSRVPRRTEMLVETFPRAKRHYLVCYPFEGRLAHQTLGMLLTRRMERLGARPLGFVANEYALAVWATRDLSLMVESGLLSLAALFEEDMLGDDLGAWLAESSLMKRTFRSCAVIAGLIERRFPGKEKSGRQVTFSSDLIYDVLRQHEPDHVLLRAAWDDAAAGLLDIRRLSDMLARIRGHIVHRRLETVSPLAVPVMLEIGREPVYGEADEALLQEAADELVAEAMRLV